MTKIIFIVYAVIGKCFKQIFLGLREIVIYMYNKLFTASVVLKDLMLFIF